MNNLPASRRVLWQELIQKIRAEWNALETTERLWIIEKINRLSSAQQKLHRLVCEVEGETVCHDCGGGCCGDGFYHPTLVTILAHLVLNRCLPTPDFSQSCPYLGAEGCLFTPEVRPFNCLIFICEKIENRCKDKQLLALQLLELEIRGLYQEFDRRYVGSSLRGLLNQPANVTPQGLLERRRVQI